jgi:hypothetical protein
LWENCALLGRNKRKPFGLSPAVCSRLVDVTVPLAGAEHSSSVAVQVSAESGKHGQSGGLAPVRVEAIHTCAPACSAMMPTVCGLFRLVG